MVKGPIMVYAAYEASLNLGAFPKISSNSTEDLVSYNLVEHKTRCQICGLKGGGHSKNIYFPGEHWYLGTIASDGAAGVAFSKKLLSPLLA
jgi:hypothetical protein